MRCRGCRGALFPTTRGWCRPPCRILVASSEEKLADGKGDLWDSGEMSGDRQLLIPYGGTRLVSNQRAWWKVIVSTNKGKAESDVAIFGIGLLGESHWGGRWIGLEGLQEDEHAGEHTRLAARYLRKEFKLKKRVKRATAYICGLGLYEMHINGQKIGGNQVLAPAPTDYRKTVIYNTFDITDQLNGTSSDKGINSAAKNTKKSSKSKKSSSNAKSSNAKNSSKNNKSSKGKKSGASWDAPADSIATVAVILGNGRLYPMRQNKAYKTPVFGFPKCRVNIIVEYEGGGKETWKSDETWKITTAGPIRSNNEYDGEEYDARKEMPGWDKKGFDDSKWLPAQRSAIPEGTLRGQSAPNMTETPLYDIAFPRGGDFALTNRGSSCIIDAGQNVSGWIGVRLRGNSGDTIRVRYAEKLNADGSLYRDNLRDALSEDIYICNGTDDGTFHRPLFSYHGFRYAEVTGLRNASAADFKVYAVWDEMAAAGSFVCSDTTLTKVVRNAWWGIRDNYKGMPVDCPQRNERQPWLGDRTMGSLGESYLFDNAAMYSKWMRDILEAQRSDGCIPDVAPAFWNYYTDNVTWPAALPFTCDMLYRQFGDPKAIENSYDGIAKWINHITDEYSKDGIVGRDRYGDWCVPPEKLNLIHSNDEARKTDGSLISTAYTIRVYQLMRQFAEIIGRQSDIASWQSKEQAMKDAFNKKFLTCHRGTSPVPGHPLYPDSVYYGNNTATANLLALAFGIVPDSLRDEVTKNVVENIIVKNKEHVSCGVIGISWLLRGLSDNGYADVAYMLATNKTYPSWGYMAENGATTIWELWNGDKANPKMNSGNHVMLLGDLLPWCFEYIGGIRATAPGFKTFCLQPSFEIQDCSSADVSHDSPYGKIRSSWKKTLRHLEWDVEIPCNTSADVYLPSGVKHLGSGKYHFSEDFPAADKMICGDEFIYENASFPQCHATTIAELDNGDLVSAYFGGTHERNPDVCIWVSRKPAGASEWEAPILAADGVVELGTQRANIAGISGANDSTTAATAGPICKASKTAPWRSCAAKPAGTPCFIRCPTESSGSSSR